MGIARWAFRVPVTVVIAWLHKSVKKRDIQQTAAVLLVPVLGVAGVVWEYLDAEQQKQEAQPEAAKGRVLFCCAPWRGPRQPVLRIGCWS